MVRREFGFCEFCPNCLFDFPILSGFLRGFFGGPRARNAAGEGNQNDRYIKESLSHT
jgi:hypothetical protein